MSLTVVPQNTEVIESAESASYRPRLPRETRRLLLTAFVAVLTLWVLARVRFPERPAAPNPVPPILDQLTGPPTFAELAARVLALQNFRVAHGCLHISIPFGSGMSSVMIFQLTPISRIFR